jgi:hypothetical protein
MAGERYNTTEDLLAQYIPPEGISIDSSGNATDPEQQKLLDRQREKEEGEGESSPSPLAMGLLQLGASMMRDEGWRDRPITLGESLGKAIPRGIAGYYNQDALNRQYEGEAAQQQMLEDQAEATRLQGLAEQDEKVKRYKAFVANVESTPDAAFGRTPGSASNRKQNLIQMFLDNPEKAMKALEDIWAKQAEIANRVPAKKTYTEIKAEEKSAILKIRRDGIQNKLAGLGMMDDVPEATKQRMQDLYGDPDTLTEENVIKFREDYATAMGERKPRDYTNEREKLYSRLRNNPATWKSLTRSQQLQVAATEDIEDNKEARDALQKIIYEKKDEGGWYEVSATDTYAKNGQKTTKVVMQNDAFPGKTRTKVTNSVRGSVIQESFTGKQLKTDVRFKDKWAGVQFDKDKIYNLEKDVYGNWKFSGTILDMSPGKQDVYAKNMIETAAGMNLIPPNMATRMAGWDPKDAIAYLNDQFIKFADEKRDVDLNEGLIKTGAEINKTAKDDGKTEWATVGRNYYWDGTTWQDMNEGDAQAKFNNAADLRKEFDKNTKKFKDSIFAYNSIVKGYENSLDDPASAGVNDIMIVRAFLLMIEPNSVVRESEFATAAKSQGAYNYTINLIDRMEHGSILTKESRARFFRAAMQYMTAVKSGYQLQEDRYKKIADKYKIDHDEVILDPFADRPELIEGAGAYTFKPRMMGKDDFKFLENVKLTAPPGKKGNTRRRSNLGKVKFIRK